MRIPESDHTAMRYVVNRDEAVQHIIEGIVFYAYSSRGNGNTLPDDENIDIVVTPPVDNEIGIGFITRIGGDAEFKVYENVSNVVGGTIYVPKNRNRASSRTAQTGIIIQPTSLTTNGVLYEEIIVGGSGGNAAGASLEGDYAILRADTSYLFRLTNRSGQTRIAELFVQWIEYV